MGLSIEHMEYGMIVGNAFTFEQAGDVLEWHGHEKGSGRHIVIVGRGEFKMEVEGAPECIIKAGDLINPPDDPPHQFTALVAGSKLFNICKEELKNGR